MTCRAPLTHPHVRLRQAGIALVVALVFLLVLTILGVTAMQSATLQERMAGNVRDRNVGFQAAEAALRAGEDWVEQEQLWADLGRHESESFVSLREDEPDIGDLDCDDGNLRTVNVDGVDRNPCFMIIEYESIRPVGDMSADVSVTAFRVIGIGTGRSPDARVVLSTTSRYEN